MVKTGRAWRTSSPGGQTAGKTGKVDGGGDEWDRQTCGVLPRNVPHDRSLIPVAVALGVIVALWLCLYFISEVQNSQTARAEARAAAVLVSRPVSH